jgi:hypothetical protein
MPWSLSIKVDVQVKVKVPVTPFRLPVPPTNSPVTLRQAGALGPEIFYPAEFILEADVACQFESANVSALYKVERLTLSAGNPGSREGSGLFGRCLLHLKDSCEGEDDDNRQSQDPGRNTICHNLSSFVK